MSLLSVTVKKARFVCEEAAQFNSYVTLKLQNVKSTTVTVKGANPCWEQDFLFETNDMNTGLLVEVWCKGLLWDRFLGYFYVPLSEVSYMNEVTSKQSYNASSTVSSGEQEQQQRHIPPDSMRDTNSNTQPPDITNTEGAGEWVSLDLELEMRGADIVGTKKPTGHSLLIDCRLELPFDPENTEAADLQRKLEMLNNMMDQEARAEQARRQILYNIGHSGYSEDSDYTSDLNYPVGGQGANSSASQFRTAANQLATPQRSLETSRENSYERDDHQIPATVGGRLAPSSGYGSYGGSGHSPRYDEPYPEEGPPQRYSQSQHASESSEPLFYNSRPRHYKEYRRRKHTWDYEDSQDGWYSEGYDYPGTRVDETRIYSDTEYCYPSTTTSSSRRRGPHRRPSLERQMTLYDDHSYYADGYSSDGRVGKMSATYPESQTDIRYNEYYDSITGYTYQNERYGQDDEDRQWDSGGKWYLGTSTYYENKRNRKTLPQRPASSIGIHRPDYRPTVTRQRSYESDELNYSSHSRRWKPLQPQQRPPSRQEGTGKKLPPTPTKPSNVIMSRKLASLPATPSRQLPKTRTPSEESYYKSDYNEDYNYAYRSQDNLPQETYIDSVHTEQSGYSQHPVYDLQAHPSTKSQYPDESQYGPSYVAPVDDQYGRPYQEPPTQDTYDQTYAGEYQTPYVQPNTQVYPDTYQDMTYPNTSQPNDQYTSQLNDQYAKPGIQDNYPAAGYEQNNVQYQEPKTKPYTYKEDTYQGPYEDYSASVPSSVYDQNNVTNTYNQYPADNYDSQYNINTSTGYQNTYPDTYNQQDTYVQQDGYNQQEAYKDTYNQQEAYKDTYNQQEVYKDTYNQQEPYKEPYNQQEPYKDTNNQQETYKDTYNQQEPYKDTYNQQEPYKDAYNQQEPYKDTYNQQEPYKDMYNQQEPYKDTYNQQEPYKDTYNQQEPYKDTYNQQEPFKDTYNQQEVYKDTYNQQEVYKDTYNQQDAYKDTYNQQEVYKDTYNQQETYDSYNQQDTYKEPYSKQDTYGQQEVYKDTYEQPEVYKDTYNQQDTYKDTYNQQDAYKDTYNQQDTYKDTYNQQDGYRQEEAYKQVPVTSQSSYEESYGDGKDYVDYQTPYSEADSGTTYTSDYHGTSTERRLSEVPELSVTTPRGQTRANGYHSGDSDYYYTSQESQDMSPASQTKKKLTKEPSPLIQQHTLDSREDEFIEPTVDTAIPQKKGIVDYPAVSDSTPIGLGLIEPPVTSAVQPATTMMNHVAATRVTVQAMVHTTTPANGKRLTRADSYQEEVIEDEEYPDILPKEPQRKDSQLSHHSQLSQHSQISQHSQKRKLTRGDSYASDHFPDEAYGRRDSYGQQARKDSFSSTTQEGFKPPLTRTDSYQSRGSYAGRTDSYQRGYFKDQETIDEPEVPLSAAGPDDYTIREDTSIERYEREDETILRGSREGSLVDTFKTTPPMSHTDSPRGSISKQASLEESVQMDTPPRSPPEQPPDEELLDMVGVVPVPTQLKERPEMTAKQRWHWAYNQIVMQLRRVRVIQDQRLDRRAETKRMKQ